MDTQSAWTLFNLAPLGRVAGVGALIALGPLAWLALQHHRGRQASFWQALTVTTVFLTFDLILFGSFTRLTDSGLGCPDWPGCYGQASPLAAMDDISAAHQAMPTGAVSESKAWIEMLHRYLATAVGGLILLAWLGALWHKTQGRRGLTTLTLLWVLLQGAFGAFTVTLKLFPAVVTLHLVGGMVLLLLLLVQLSAQQHPLRSAVPAAVPTAVSTAVPPALRTSLWLALALVAVQVLLGGWVSTNYAVLVCDTFPQCQGSWWPSMDFAAGFELWRPLGLGGDGQPLVFSALTAIHYTHRLMAYVVFAFVGSVAWRMARVQPPLGRALGAVLVLQLLTGLSNVVLGWPLLAAVMHTGGAAALLGLLVWCLCRTQSQRPVTLALTPV